MYVDKRIYQINSIKHGYRQRDRFKTKLNCKCANFTDFVLFNLRAFSLVWFPRKRQSPVVLRAGLSEAFSQAICIILKFIEVIFKVRVEIYPKQNKTSLNKSFL